MESLLCAICLNTDTSFDFSVVEPCGHVFHKTCLRQWSAGSQNSILQCPKCRCQINKHFQLYVEYDDKLALKNAQQAEEIKNLKSNLIESSSKIAKLNSKMAGDKVRMKDMIRSFNKVHIGQKETITSLKNELCSTQKELTSIKDNAKKLALKNTKLAEESKNLQSKIANLKWKMASDKVEMNKRIHSLDRENIRQKQTMISVLNDLTSAQKDLTAIKKIQELEAKKSRSPNNYNNLRNQENKNVDHGHITDEDIRFWEEYSKIYYQEYDDYYCNMKSDDDDDDDDNDNDGQRFDEDWNTESIRGSNLVSTCDALIIFIIFITTLYLL